MCTKRHFIKWLALASRDDSVGEVGLCFFVPEYPLLRLSVSFFQMRGMLHLFCASLLH